LADPGKKRLCIAVDGPASSGKGTVARHVAEVLGYQYVDTGAMYRVVALVAQQRGVPWHQEDGLTALAVRLQFRFEWDEDLLRILVDGKDVTSAIRSEEIGQGASAVSRLPGVRQALLGLQQGLGHDGGVVMDGRDIGTVVLPDAELKVFLDADVEERALRRHEELLRKGEQVHYHDVLHALEARDSQDRNRAVAPLKAADDAVHIDTTKLTIRQAIDRVLELAHQRGA